jgi:hypothetical protein
MRVVMRVGTQGLLPALRHVQADGRLRVDHVYDY